MTDNRLYRQPISLSTASAVSIINVIITTQRHAEVSYVPSGTLTGVSNEGAHKYEIQCFRKLDIFTSAPPRAQQICNSWLNYAHTKATESIPMDPFPLQLPTSYPRYFCVFPSI